MLRPSLLMMLARSGIGRLILRLMLDRRVSIWSKLIIPGGIVYMVSPIDVLPDIIPIMGWIDDMLAIVLAVTLFLLSVPRDILREHIGHGKAAPRDGSVIDGSARVVDDDADDKGKRKRRPL